MKKLFLMCSLVFSDIMPVQTLSKALLGKNVENLRENEEGLHGVDTRMNKLAAFFNSCDPKCNWVMITLAAIASGECLKRVW